MNTLTFFILFIPVLVLILLIVNKFTSVSRPDAEKVSPYECGFSPLGSPREKFSIQFYLVAILFLVFDLEILLIFPFAVSLHQISTYGFWVFILFLGILTIGFLYEISKGALKFHKNPEPKEIDTPSFKFIPIQSRMNIRIESKMNISTITIKRITQQSKFKFWSYLGQYGVKRIYLNSLL